MKNLPNILTGIRIAIIPILVLIFYSSHPVASVVASFLFAIAAITDYFDGYFARSMKAQSNFGKCLDPIADKLIVIITTIMLISFSNQDLAILIPGLIIISREVLVSGLREFLASIKISVPVSRLSKYKTMLQMVAITILLLGEKGVSYIIYSQIANGILSISAKILFVTIVIQIGKALFAISAILTVLTGYSYLKIGLKNM